MGEGYPGMRKLWDKLRHLLLVAEACYLVAMDPSQGYRDTHMCVNPHYL